MSYSGSDLQAANAQQISFQINGHANSSNVANPISAANLAYTLESITINGKSVSLLESSDGNTANSQNPFSGPTGGITGSALTTLAAAIATAINAYYSIT